MRSMFLIAAAIGLILASPFDARAQGQVCPEQGNLVKAGTWKAKGTTVGFLVGVRWGSGTVTFNDGTTRKFRFKGGKVVDIGVTAVEFEGTVYNLKRIADFEGLYSGIGTGIAIVKGLGGASVTNQHCVVLNGKAVKTRGLRASLPAPTAISIRFDD